VRLSDLLDETRCLLTHQQDRSQELQDRLENTEDRLKELEEDSKLLQVTETRETVLDTQVQIHVQAQKTDPSPRAEKARVRKLQREAEMIRVQEEQSRSPVTPPKVETG